MNVTIEEQRISEITGTDYQKNEQKGLKQETNEKMPMWSPGKPAGKAKSLIISGTQYKNVLDSSESTDFFDTGRLSSREVRNFKSLST